MDDNNEKDRVLDILLEEYKCRFTEMMFHDGHYYRSHNYIYWFFAVFISFPWLNSQDTINISAGTWGFLLLIALLVISFIIATMLSALFHVYARRIRISAIELQINEILNRDLLVMDSYVTPILFSNRFKGYKAWKNPMKAKSYISLFLGIVQLITQCYLCYVYCHDLFIIYLILTLIIVVFFTIQWINLHSTGWLYLTLLIKNKEFPPEDFINNNIGLSFAQKDKALLLKKLWSGSIIAKLLRRFIKT